VEVYLRLLHVVPLLVGGALGLGCESHTVSDADADIDAPSDADVDQTEAVPEPSSWVWDVWGPEGRQYANTVVEAEDESVFVGGFFSPFDAAPGASTDRGWLARIGPDGQARWELFLPTGTGRWIAAMAPHPDGGVVVVGNADPGASLSGLVAHVDADGAPVWRLEWEIGNGLVWPWQIDSIRQTREGTFVIAGQAHEWITDGPWWVWIAELTAQGELVWQRTLLEVEHFDNAALAMASNADILLAWTNSDGGAWLARLDRAGTPIWARYMVLNTYAGSYSIDVTEASDSDIMLVSMHDGTLVMRFDEAGDLLWQRTLGPEVGPYGAVILAEPDGSAIVGGARFYEGDQGIDLSMLGVDRDGEPTWSWSLGTVGCEAAHDAVLARDGSVIVVTGGCQHAMVAKFGADGNFNGDCDLPRPTSTGSSPADMVVERVTLSPEDTDLAPVTTSFDPSATTSAIEVLCQSQAE
jgi:hypothetical protein